MWIPDWLYARLPLLYAIAGISCLVLFTFEAPGLLSASSFFLAASLTFHWRRVERLRHRDASQASQRFIDSCFDSPTGAPQAPRDELIGLENSSRTLHAAVVRFPDAQWSEGLLRSLKAQPERGELVSLVQLAEDFVSRSGTGLQRWSVEEAYELLLRALLGIEELQGALASKLPVFDLTGEQPRQLLSADSALREMLVDIEGQMVTGNVSVSTLNVRSTTMGIHRRGAIAAFDLPSDYGAGRTAARHSSARD
ncbi:MAG TPA: hypothetical protein VGQ91_08310, partial [Ideonella sp.]|nr:hypothetical protein [Ideonella sp.]